MLDLIAALALASAPDARASTPTPTPHSNLHPREIQSGGERRQWLELIPERCAARANACDVVLMLHGGNPTLARGGGGRLGEGAGARRLQERMAGRERTPEAVARATGMVDAASRAGVVLVVPQAVAGNWNDGRPGVASEYDDVAFLRALLDDLAQRVRVDPARTFATGVSNGGLMSYRLACDAPDRIRAVAAVVANMGSALSGQCRGGAAVDVLQIVGRADPLMPYAGGGVAGRQDGGRGGVLSAEATFAFWAERLPGARVDTRTLPPDVTVRTATAPAGRVVQYTLAEYGHGWPTASAASPGGGQGNPMMARLRGKNPSGFSATDTVMAFFAATAVRAEN